MKPGIKVLIIGGYGTFGGRLARLLSNDRGLEVLVAGRSAAKARSFAARVGGTAVVRGIPLDRHGDLQAAFAAHRPDVVVDASGPFQAYTEHPYRVVEAAIASGCGYLDLADDPEFVRGVTSFDAAARDAGVFVLSGVSSCPALTGAIYRHIARDFAEVDAVAGGIAPSPYAGVGPNVIEAIASYAGRPIETHTGGGKRTSWPFTEVRRYTVAPPGAKPLRSLNFSLVDVPDLTLLAELEPAPATVWFGAAPVPAIYHGLFRALARGVKHGLLPSLAPLAPLMNFAMNNLSWGEHRGGLFLACSGRDADGRALERSWHLVAEGNTGPMTPALASVAIVRACAAGKPPAPGARPAHAELTLDRFEPLFAALGVVTGERERGPARPRQVFRRVLGQAWDALPPQLAAAHDGPALTRFSGHADVIRGKSLPARLIGALFRFPVAGEHVPVSVTMRREGDREVWLRDFDGRRFSSELTEGRGRWDGLLCERFGLIRFGSALVVDDRRLRFVIRRWSIAGVTMPQTLMPKSRTFESVRDGRFCFDVEIAFPILGHVVTYRGWLAPAADA